MIAALTGKLSVKELDHIIVDVQGVGYWVSVSMQTLAELPNEGENVHLRCYTHVREDALALYGFLDDRERQAFIALISVSGIGPKLALTVLSGLPVDSLFDAIASADHKRLQAVPGIGKRTAERLVVELKDRMKSLNLVKGEKRATSSDTHQDIIAALTNLGYRQGHAEKALKRVLEGTEDSSGFSAEELLRKTLSMISEV